MRNVLILCVAALLASCGMRVEIPTGYVGKVLGPAGLESGIKTPSSFRLPVVMPWEAKSYLILAQTSDETFEESGMVVYMPKDRLNLTFDVRLTATIPVDETVIADMFSRLTHAPTEHERIRQISIDHVYATYAQPIIRQRARETLARYTILEVLTNRAAVSQEMVALISEDLKTTPIRVFNFGLSDVQPPDVIVRAQETAKEREIAIEKAESEKAIALTQAGAQLEVARRQQEIDLLEAETQARVEEILASKVTQAFVIQRGLRVLEGLAASNNNVIFLPYEALSNPAILLPTLNASLNNGK